MKEEIINTLKDLLSFKTYENNKEEFIKAFDYIKEKYNMLYIEEFEFNEKKALVLSNTTEKKLDIIFCTHIDVVYSEDYSFKEDENNIYGRGTIDMKCSIAVCLNILSKIQTKKKIALFITSDEEITGHCASELTKIYHSKFAIVPDGGTNFEMIIEEKGLLQLELSIETKTAHAAQLFNGINAITELINIYEKLIERYPLPKSNKEYITSINLSKLNGGISNNQVPGHATMILDIRNIRNDKQDSIINYIKQMNKNIKIKILTSDPVFITDINNEYVKKYIKSCETILARKIKLTKCESTSDAIFFSQKGIPTVIMNPEGYYAHSPKEYVNKDSLVKLYNIYKHFIEEEK